MSFRDFVPMPRAVSVRGSACVLATAALIAGGTAWAARDPALQAGAPGHDMVAGIATTTKPTLIKATITTKNKVTVLYGLVEYNTKTCKEISSGAWTVAKKPTKGKTSTSILTSTLGNHACPGKKFKFGVINYDWTTGTGKDSFSANWKTPDGHFNVPFKFALTLG